MIACISSTITPSVQPSHDGARSNISPAVRLEQTVESVQSLVALGFKEIHLVDNSATPPSAAELTRLLPAHVYHYSHYNYRNKGIGEVRLLLELCARLPENRPIMKLSGRYRASLNLCEQLGDTALAGLISKAGTSRASLSTRGYAVSDAAFWRRFLQGSLDEMYAAPWRITGPRSLASIFTRLLRPANDTYPYSDPRSGLEICAARWLTRYHIPVTRLDHIGIEGIMGSWINPPVSE